MAIFFDNFNPHAHAHARFPLATKTLAALGLFWSARQVFKLASFLRVFFLRRSSFGRYVASPDGTAGAEAESWALVTGASDGIGKGFARELCARGVNVILHGRNERKLERVREEILAEWPERQVRLFVMDANVGETDVPRLVEACKAFEDVRLRVLVHNVGGVGAGVPLWAPLAERSSEVVGRIVNINVRFMTELTRVLLPQLVRSQPALIVTIGSGISEFAVPYFQMYSGAKAYMQAWARSMRLEFKADKQDIEVLHIQVGKVSSGPSPAQRATVNLMCPTPRRFAQSCLDAAGCGREVIWAYWPHALQFGLMLSLPTWLLNMIVLDMAIKERATEEEESKTQ